MFNGPKVTQTFYKLLLNGEVKEAHVYLESIKESAPVGEKTRIDRLYSTLNNAKEQISRINTHKRKLNLKQANTPAIKLEAIPNNILDLDYGTYSHGQNYKKKSNFNKDFHNSPTHLKEQLIKSRFNIDSEDGDYSSFSIVSNARLCGDTPSLHAYAFNENHYISQESGRLAKCLAINIENNTDNKIDTALLLPIPHHNKNYYHVMSEMIYGLRYAKYIPNNTPIIYQEDSFSIIKEFKKYSFMENMAFLSFKDADGFFIKKAVIPHHPPYFWTKSVYDFFSANNTRDSRQGLKIYVSRRLGSRGPKNELEIETFLTQKGFLVIFPEFLPFSIQRQIFLNSDFVVAPHGAGLTNIAFMPSRSHLIEILPEKMLARDFYMRAQKNSINYRACIFDGTLNIQELDDTIKELASLP